MPFWACISAMFLYFMTMLACYLYGLYLIQSPAVLPIAIAYFMALYNQKFVDFLKDVVRE